jgi:hypothetical protein
MGFTARLSVYFAECEYTFWKRWRQSLSLLKNKHVLTAVIVTPVLAIIGYFAFDFMVTEPPQVAEKGQSYRLVEKPNCRYDSGRCGLKNSEFELELVIERLDDSHSVLKLKSVFPLDGVLVAQLENGQEEKTPRDMSPLSEDGMTWSLELGVFDPDQDRLRLAASAQQSLYFGDVALKFALGN